ncbi:hypothetical protein [Gloeocapsopsis crepidinum]|nr:hypothetical protein [Gloeocapsopsis crepidinum]
MSQNRYTNTVWKKDVGLMRSLMNYSQFFNPKWYTAQLSEYS